MVAEATVEFVRQPQSARKVLAFLFVLRCVAGMNAVTMVAVGFAETVAAVCLAFWDRASMSVSLIVFPVSVASMDAVIPAELALREVIALVVLASWGELHDANSLVCHRRNIGHPDGVPSSG